MVIKSKQLWNRLLSFSSTQFSLKAIQAKLTFQLFKYDNTTKLNAVRQKEGTPAFGMLTHPKQMSLLLLMLSLMGSLTTLKRAEYVA